MIIRNLEELNILAKKIAKYLDKNDTVFLKGEVGAGKTELTKHLAQHLGSKDSVSSPTFSIMNIYNGDKKIYHFDLYRLEDEDAEELEGLSEFFYDDAIAVVEWPKTEIEELIPESLTVFIDKISDKEREISLSSKNKKYDKLIMEIKEGF